MSRRTAGKGVRLGTHLAAEGGFMRTGWHSCLGFLGPPALAAAVVPARRRKDPLSARVHDR